MKLFKWVVSLISVSLLGFPAKINATNIVEKKQRAEEITSKEKTNLLVLQHAKELFREDGLKNFAGHRSHASHASHRSHYSSSGGSTIYTPPTQSKPTSSSDTYVPPTNQNKTDSQDESSTSPYTSKSIVLKVEGIMYSKDKPLVMIGGGVYGLHAVVGGGEITDIFPHGIVIKFKDKSKIYKIDDVIDEGGNAVSN